MISSNKELSASNTPFACGWSDIVAGSPVRASMPLMSTSFAPSRSD